MKQTPFTIGITALFDPRSTAHARTFLRALAVAAGSDPRLARARLVFADDGACPRRALTVAGDFVARGVDLVVGHFSSDAAAAAGPIYARHGIPLLLPAATTSSLTAGSTNMFRICPSDAVLARRLAGYMRQRGWRAVAVESDDSLHGAKLAETIRASAAAAGLALVQSPQAAHACVFAGRLRASAGYVAERRAAGYRGPIVLTDDAASPHLLDAIAAPGELVVFGFADAAMLPQAGAARAAHRQLFGTEPEVYFIESIAALSIAAGLAERREGLLASLAGDVFETAAGPVRFIDGERAQPLHALWSVDDGRLRPQHLVND